MKLKHLLLLLMAIVSFSTARAATDESDFKFNDGVRYSQWVVNSRLNSFSANTAKMGLATFNADGTQIGSRDDGGKTKLDYVPGLVAKGVIEATRYYSQFTWAAPWTKPWFLSVADYGNKWYNVSEAGGSLDDLNGVKLYFALSELAKTDGYANSDAYNNAVAAIGHAVAGLKAHNTSCVIESGTLAGDDVVGGWWHKKAYNNQMWLDGQYMGPALLAQIINHNKSTANISTDDWKIIIKQLDAVWKMCWNAEDKLLYHAFEANGGKGTTDSHAELWAGLSTSNLHSASYWGRACGWYFLALVDILHEMDNAKLSSQNTYTDEDYTRIKGYLTSLAAGLRERQDVNTGGWYQILDKDGTYSASEYNNGLPHTLTYNYIESSATAIFAAAYLKAIRLGYLAESEYGATAKKAYQCIVNNFFAADSNDGVHIFGSCRSAGLGSDKTDGTWAEGEKNFRDGSNEYYLLGYDATRVAKSDNETEGKVLGAFILASTEYEQLYQKDKILFSKDLAPAYPLTSADTSISIEAFGADNIEYRWYNVNDENTVVATTSTFTPTASGSYYCTATAGGETITSSTTNVTVIAETEGEGNADNSAADVLNVTENEQSLILSKDNIDANGFISTTTENWSDRTYNGSTYKLYNLSSTSRAINLKVAGATGFEIKVDNSSAGRTYVVKVGETTKTITHGGNKVESSGKIVISDQSATAEISIQGGGTSVYPCEIIFYTNSTGSTDVTTTFGNGTLNDNVLTVMHEANVVGEQILTITPAMGAKYEVTSNNATISPDYKTLTYTTPAAGQSMAIKLLVTAEAGNTAEYTINVSTKSAGGGGNSGGDVYVWFGNTLDITANGFTENTDYFSGMPVPNNKNTSGYSESVTINDKTYKVNGKTGSENPTISFTIDDEQKGFLYFIGGSSGTTSSRTLVLAKDGNTYGEVKTITGTTPNNVSYENLPAGSYTLTATGGNIQIALLAMKLVDESLLKFEEGKGTLTDRTLTVIHEPADAGKTDCTIGITLTDGMTCTLGTLPDGVTASLSADGKLLTYTAPAAGTGFISIPLIATADGKSYEYTVLVGTRVAPSYTSQYDSNKAWTPAVGGTIALSKLINYERDESNPVTVASGDAATLSADAQTLTAVKTGEITLSLPATDNYAAASMTIQVNIGTDVDKGDTNAYTVESSKVYSDGLTVSRENITMAFGNDGFWAQNTDTWTQGQNNPTPNSGKIPTSGTYYKFTPAKNGTLAVNVYIGKTDDGNLRPLYVSENGTAIEAKAGELIIGKGETPVAPAVGYYQGDVTFSVKANTDYYVYVNGSKMRLLGFEFTQINSSDATVTFDRGTLTGNVLTVTHAENEAEKEHTITVIPATGATCTFVSGSAVLDGNALTYTAPATGTSLNDIVLKVTAENGNDVYYTIKISTIGTASSGNATFTLAELQTFGSRESDANKTLEKTNVRLSYIKGTGSVEGQTGSNGTKVKSGAGLVITPKNGVLITKVIIVTSSDKYSFTATPSGEVTIDGKDYIYTFSSLDGAVTFMNNYDGQNLYANSITVEYKRSVDDGKTILTASFDKDELTFYEDDTEIPALPVLSVKIGDEVADAGLYTVTYTSSNLNVVRVDEYGELTKVGAGSAVINAEIFPKSTDVYAGSEAFYTVTVTSLEEPVVTAHDLTVYNTAGVQPQPVIEVFATDNGMPVRISNYYYTLKFTEIEDNDDIIKNDADGKFILNGEPGDWRVGATATMKVTVIPTDEAKQRFHIKETVAEFKVTVVVTGDMLLPYFGGVENGKMQKSALVNVRTFITPVLYGGVDISEGFTFDYSFVEGLGSTTAKTTAARLKNGTKKVSSITGSTDAEVTIYSGNDIETVYVYVVAKPNNDYKTQYKQIEKWISVDIGDYKRFLEVSIEPTKQTVPVGTVLDQLNDFTVTVRDEDGKILSYEDGEYTTVWQSSSPGVASVDRGEVAMYATGRKVRALSGGVADIKVIVSKGEYSDMGAVCTLTVTDDGMFKVDGNTTYSKGSQFTVDGLTLSLGGWMFSNMSDLAESPWLKYGTTSEKPGEKTAWGAPTSANKKPLGFTHNIQMTNMKNARQEYGSNCMPESRNIYNPKLVEQEFVLMDPMFNVPCAGAYFALSPMTCGTVTVYVRQNGIFENSSGEYAYRPQRRVFVMDEQGHFVSSTPKLEYPTNWDMGDDGTLFKCDILDKTVKEKSLYELAGADPTKVAGEVPAEAERQKVRDYVQDRLVGLKNFSIQNFKNGVYASNIVDTTFHNAAYEKYKGTPDELAARGWSVLSVAPVSYTFYVKPGKTYYIYNFGSKLGLYGFTFRKDNVTEDEFNWTDTKDVTPEPTAERHVAKVNIDRTFKAGVWAACVLPFSMTRQQVNAVFGDCYDNQEGHENGTQILYFDRVENGTIYFRRHAYNTLVAGKPFLIKPAKEAVISSANMGDYPYVTIEAETPQAEWGRTVGNAVDIGSVDTDFTWVSSYGSMTALPGDYYLNGSGNVSHCTEGHQIAIKGFRGYLKAKTKQAASKVLKLVYDSNVDGDGTATAIESLVMDGDGNFLEVPTSGIVYNLSGQVVTRDADRLYTLPAGIYIVNGKKYIVR